jgi:hypothetical protein
MVLCSGNTVLDMCVCMCITGNLKAGETTGYPGDGLHTSPIGRGR